MYNALLKNHRDYPTTPTSFPFKEVWKANVPLNVRFFTWSLMWGRNLTKDRLHSMGITENATCVLCNSNCETVSHLFVLCPMTQMVWQALIGHLNRASTVLQHDDPKVIITAWPCINTRGIGEDIWLLIPYALMWVIWSVRNNIIFSNGKFELQKTVKIIKYLIWAWLEINGQRRNLKKDHRVSELLQGWEMLIQDEW
ncbi:hypothetical protein FRX31_024380 [Thalictrum thalictroides]|uniref:Reverse transcriptase zinc-binding domain-containing protein n=1 Tax=Thalictrum thalictroides TaxID=46969 RepID=A0A7J6VMP2_THATH|nr:hypothetical protein FRX31_024380 [Thalictrum thalictroides]